MIHFSFNFIAATSILVKGAVNAGSPPLSVPPTLANYMESFDRCMLHLNILAIETILSILKKATGDGEAGAWPHGAKKGTSVSSNPCSAISLESVKDVEERHTLYRGEVKGKATK